MSASLVVNLRDVPGQRVPYYFKEHPLSDNSCLTYSYDPLHLPMEGEIHRLLQDIPVTEREKVVRLCLDYARLLDSELTSLPILFPKLLEISLGFEVSPECLGGLVESIPNLRSLCLRRLNMGNQADAHIERLTQAAQHGALQTLTTLKFLQTKGSSDTWYALFSVLPKLEHLSFAGVMLDGHIPMLLRAFREGPLKKLKEFGMGTVTGLSPENEAALIIALPGERISLDDFLDSDERIEVLRRVIQEGVRKKAISGFCGLYCHPL